MTDTVSLGSCPTCGGPAQFIGDVAAADARSWHGVTVREVKLPNVDEDLGGGWALVVLDSVRTLRNRARRWRAYAVKPNPAGGAYVDQETGFGPDPSAAYLALRSAIEARP